MIDATHLRVFLTIAEQGSFSRAAEVLHLSQPALSTKIALLERQLGVPVLERGPQGAAPNDFGKLLMRHARALKVLLDDAAREIHLRKLGIEGPLVVGGTPVCLVRLIAPALGRLEQDLSSISVSLIEGEDEALLEQLRAGELDIVVCTVTLDPIPADIEEEPLLSVGLEIITRADNALGTGEPIGLEMLQDARWALPPPGGSYRRQIEAAFLTAGVQFPSHAILCNSMTSMRAVVREVDCVALLPREAVALELSAWLLKASPLSNQRARRYFGTRRRRGRALSPLGECFLLSLRNIAAEAPACEGS